MSSPVSPYFPDLGRLQGVTSPEEREFERELRDQIWRETVADSLLRHPCLFFAWLMASMIGLVGALLLLSFRFRNWLDVSVLEL
jgi:hypothetical protein